MRGERWFGANQAAAALEAFEQRGFLAADIGASADADFEIETVRGAADMLTERPARFAAVIAAFIASTACGYSERM